MWGVDSSESAHRLAVDTAQAYLDRYAWVLLAVAVLVSGLAAKDWVQRRGAAGETGPRSRRALVLVWVGSAVVCSAFMYFVRTLSPERGYDYLLGPPWISWPILMSISALGLPLVVLLAGSILERTRHQIVTKLNLLLLLYVYGALYVDEQIPMYLLSAPGVERFHYVGAGWHALLIAVSFATEYGVLTYVERLRLRSA